MFGNVYKTLYWQFLATRKVLISAHEIVTTSELSLHHFCARNCPGNIASALCLRYHYQTAPSQVNVILCSSYQGCK